VTGYFERALRNYESTVSEKKNLADAYANLLNAQTKTSTELVNNEEFLEWTLSDCNDNLKPEFSEEMLKTFMPE
jgi:hypothetical protein